MSEQRDGEERGEAAHFHSHRTLIGFDEHGIPTVTRRADHGDDGDDPGAFIRDYTKAVAEYRKTFPTKRDVLEKTPDPAVREGLLRAEQLGIDVAFDRFDRQKPQCGFGLAAFVVKSAIWDLAALPKKRRGAFAGPTAT